MKRGLILLACALVLSACAGWGLREPLNVTIADFTPLEINVLEQRYAIKARLLNPNDTEIAFDGVVFDLEINGKHFAKGVSNQTGLVPRFGEALIDLQMVSGLQNVLLLAGEMQKSDRVGFSYRITGQLHSPGGFGSIPFSTKGEFDFSTGGSKTGG